MYQKPISITIQENYYGSMPVIKTFPTMKEARDYLTKKINEYERTSNIYSNTNY